MFLSLQFTLQSVVWPFVLFHFLPCTVWLCEASVLLTDSDMSSCFYFLLSSSPQMLLSTSICWEQVFSLFIFCFSLGLFPACGTSVTPPEQRINYLQRVGNKSRTHDNDDMLDFIKLLSWKRTRRVTIFTFWWKRFGLKCSYRSPDHLWGCYWRWKQDKMG